LEWIITGNAWLRFIARYVPEEYLAWENQCTEMFPFLLIFLRSTPKVEVLDRKAGPSALPLSQRPQTSVRSRVSVFWKLTMPLTPGIGGIDSLSMTLIAELTRKGKPGSSGRTEGAGYRMGMSLPRNLVKVPLDA
jgi:hypothetical protein